MSGLAGFDAMFALPFVTGLLFALVLPALGMYLRLRDEWLAALAFAQLAAAGSLVAAVAGAAQWVGALLSSAFAAGLKSLAARRGNNAYALFMLLGWSCGILVLVNVPMAEHLGHALYDGQLYFTDRSHLIAAVALAIVCAFALARLSQPLLLERMFPDYFAARGLSGRRYHLYFDLLTAAAVALATASIGVMGAFCLVFLPPAIAYRFGSNWRRGTLLAVAIGTSGYCAAFAAALALDQPFGPVLVVVLGACTIGAEVIAATITRGARDLG